MFYTERFNLKKLDESNANSHYLSWFQDDVIKKFILNHPSSIAELVTFIDDCNANSSSLLLGIFSKEDKNHIGNIKFEFEQGNKFQATMGIMIGESKWRGKGGASEVISACGLFLNKSYGTKKMHLSVDHNNLPAIKSYKKIGFKEDRKGGSITPIISMTWALSAKVQNKKV